MGELYKRPVAEHDDYWHWVEADHPLVEAGYVRAVGITATAYNGPKRIEAEQLARDSEVPIKVERPYAITIKRRYQGPHSKPWVYQCGHPEDGTEHPTGTDDYAAAEQAATEHAHRFHPTDKAEYVKEDS